MRLVRWLCGAVWAGSWYLMYLEIRRWHQVKPTLAFTSDAIPGTDVRPRPGMPRKLLYLACAAAPGRGRQRGHQGDPHSVRAAVANARRG
jgi:hypothetical protein